MTRSLYPQPDDPEEPHLTSEDDPAAAPVPNNPRSSTHESHFSAPNVSQPSPVVSDRLDNESREPRLLVPDDVSPIQPSTPEIMESVLTNNTGTHEATDTNYSVEDASQPYSPSEDIDTTDNLDMNTQPIDEHAMEITYETSDAGTVGIVDGPISPDEISATSEISHEESPITKVTSPETVPETVPETGPQTEFVAVAPEATETENPTTSKNVHVTRSASIFWPKHKTTLWLFLPILLTLLAGLILSAIYPELVSLIVRSLIVIVIVIFVIFIVLGILVVVGLRDQARALLSVLFEGGLQYINFAQTLSEIWDTVVRIVQEFILAIAPFLAVFLALIFYYLVMFLFRAVGAHSDITLFTIIVTLVLASITAILGQIKIDEFTNSQTFQSQLSLRFSRVFIDSIEIAVLVIFLTIDAPHLFFLPESLQMPLQADAFGIDFMKRGITGDGLGITIRIAGAAVFVEVIRKIYRFVYSVYRAFKELRTEVEVVEGRQFSSQKEAFDTLRKASQIAYKNNLDDWLKFLGFTTILVIAFFFFPRLKLLSLLFFNLTLLAWDIAFPDRLFRKAKSEDLLSRTIAKVLKL